MMGLLPQVREGMPKLGGILIKGVLGKGGMGVVYKGIHLRLSIPVAVKVLKDSFFSGRLQDHEQGVSHADFLNEARLAAKVNHPNVVRVFDVNEENGLFYIVQEYVEGESAAALIARMYEQQTCLSESRVLEIAADIARGLVAIQQNGIVHLDIKPDNILIQKRDGIAKITDLGLAKHYRLEQQGASEKKTGTLVYGTPGYMSPEQIMGTPPGPASDVYALGATLYELATNSHAFKGIPSEIHQICLRQLDGPVPDPRVERPKLSNVTAELIIKCLSADPKNRFPDAASLLEQILNARAQLDQPLKKQDMLESLLVPQDIDGKRGAEIVCVDDDDGIRSFIEDVLTEAGHRVTTFSNGRDALTYLADKTPDMILLDVEMPQENGLKICKRLRAMPAFKEIPVVFMSGVSDLNVIDVAMQMGATDYLLKPVSPMDLQVRVACLTRLYRVQRERAQLESEYKKLKAQHGTQVKLEPKK